MRPTCTSPQGPRHQCDLPWVSTINNFKILGKSNGLSFIICVERLTDTESDVLFYADELTNTSSNILRLSSYDVISSTNTITFFGSWYIGQ